MNPWYCPRCSRQWLVEDKVTMHFHACTQRYVGEEPRRRRWLFMNPVSPSDDDTEPPKENPPHA